MKTRIGEGFMMRSITPKWLRDRPPQDDQSCMAPRDDNHTPEGD